MSIQTIQHLLPNLTASARQELSIMLTQLWEYAPQVVRYRKGKRLVLGFYWLQSGDLRCISIRPDAVRVQRWDPETNKLYYRRNTGQLTDKVSSLQAVRWEWFHDVSVTEWLERTLSSQSPAINTWKSICSCSGYRDPAILKTRTWNNINYHVLSSWVENELPTHLALHLDQNRLVSSILIERQDMTITSAKLSLRGLFSVIKAHKLSDK
jgi:hypothetical protein